MRTQAIKELLLKKLGLYQTPNIIPRALDSNPHISALIEGYGLKTSSISKNEEIDESNIKSVLIFAQPSNFSFITILF